MRFLLIYSLLFIGLQGCASASDSTVVHRLAENRADLLSHVEVSQKEVKIVSAKVQDNVIQLTLQMAPLTHEQIKNYPALIKQSYCESSDTRKLMEIGVRYNLQVLDVNSTPVMSFDVDREQCP